jgi:hypothetical protein
VHVLGDENYALVSATLVLTEQSRRECVHVERLVIPSWRSISRPPASGVLVPIRIAAATTNRTANARVASVFTTCLRSA